MITLILLLLTVCLVGSYARANTDSSKHEPFTIKTTAAGEALWALHQCYQHTQLRLKDSRVDAYYEKPENLIGFGKTLTAAELPKQVIRKINNRFHNCSIVTVMLFIKANGSIYYYAGIENTHQLIGVKISSKCRLNVLQKISLN